MKLIKRDYLQKLINVKGTPDIKVITGIRRSGKSKLLKMFIDYIKENDKNANIIHIDYNLTEFEEINTYLELNEYVDSKYIRGKNNYLLIDEVQMCFEFEKSINNLHAQEKYDIYITGSSAFLLSSDLATLFTGRTYEIEVFPFSYKEYIEYYNYKNTDETFDKYVKEGGFSGSYLYNNIEDKYNYIEDVYKTLIVRDIVQRNNIQNTSLMNNISDFLMDNISSLTSYRSISDTLNSNKIETNDKTVGSYIKYLCEAFAFYKIRRYDIQGKKYLASQDKYYLADHSVKFATLGTKNINYGRVYENIVAIELIRRGYEVYVGTLYEKEIDFVAIKRNEKIYIQVSDDISNEKTFERETSSLLKIRDAYPKLLVARTHHETYQYEGIQVIDITNWLTEKN